MPALKQAAATSWSATLRLPKSRFPPRPILADRARYLKQSCDDLYNWQRKACPPERSLFVLHDGPPYANGSLHVGHALNKILKDITCRTRLLKGRRVNYVPGWDCHGLPIELKALQEKGVQATSQKMSAVGVRNMARNLAERTVTEQKAGFREWAIMADWENAWKTTDEGYELAQLKVFSKMLGKGLIYQREKPVYWSPSSRTALAEAELEYNAEHQSTAAFFKFPLRNLPQDPKGVLGDHCEISAAIWTTTPWTLVANRAIAVHEGLEYCYVRSAVHGIMLVAASRLAELAKACNEDLANNIIRTIRGSDLLGITYRNPLLTSLGESRIVHADFVSADSGTGLVHMAPGHGMEDYKLCQSLGISPFAPVDDYGLFTAEALRHEPERLLGKHVITEGNQAVLELADATDSLIHSHAYQHSYPYDWRSKQPVIIRATKQWFADLEGIREGTLQALKNVTFIPESGRGRLESFLQTRTEWCISRQRPWGVPIPALYERDTHKAFMTPDSVAHIIDVMKDRGSEAWWTDDASDPAWIPPSLRGTREFYRGQDTMDVWFDSGTSWTQMTEPQADVYLEGTDQHRGWFQSSLLTRIASQIPSGNSGELQAPYQTLVTHGFTLDQAGRKMSKSIGNVISPSEIMDGTLLPPITRKPRKGSKSSQAAIPQFTHDALGPDALRMWVASSDFTRDVVIGQPVLQAVQNSVAKLRVTFKLLLGFLDTYQPASPIAFSHLEANNQLALLDIQCLAMQVNASYEDFQYHRAVSSINSYVAELSSGYIEAVKDRMYTDATHSPVRVQAQAVVWQIVQRLCDLLSPITPLLVEEALGHLPSQLSYHPVRDSWKRYPKAHDGLISGEWMNLELDKLAPYLKEVDAVVKTLQEEARLDGKMGSSLGSDVVIRLPKESWIAREIQMHRQAIEDMLVVSSLEIRTEPLEEGAGKGWEYRRSLDLDAAEGKVGKVEMQVTVKQPEREKCVRCWKYTVSHDYELEDALCSRCVGVLEGLRDDIPALFERKPRLDEATRNCRHFTDEMMRSHWDFS
jgi:isoleucyl-tRNA synthetase